LLLELDKLNLALIRFRASTAEFQTLGYPIPPARMSQAEKKPGMFMLWFLAFRPQTLPASVSPVVVGAALAYADGFRNALGEALAFWIFALFIQIGTNLHNDYGKRRCTLLGCSIHKILAMTSCFLNAISVALFGS